MNGIEKITERIAAEASAEAAKLLEEAEKAAAARRAELSAKAQAEYESRTAAGAEEKSQSIARAERAARLEAKKTLLGVKRSMLSAAYDEARAKLLALPEAEYIAFLAKLAADASLTGDETLLLNAADRARLGEKLCAEANALVQKRGLPGGLTLSDDCREISGGVVLKKGSIEVNCALDSLLELSHNRLDAEVADILFR